jgi:hypothetical protein
MNTVKASEIVKSGLLEDGVIGDMACDCKPRIENNEIIWEGNECWINRSVEAGKYFAQYVQFNGLTVQHDGEEIGIEEDLDGRNIEEELTDLLTIADNEKHPLHDDDTRAQLICDLLEEEGYHAWLDEQRGFANEYRVILSKKENDPDLDEFEAIDNDRAGDLIAYTGDAATQACTTLSVI